jgi:RNA polymerase sigma factor (sigma-70 family)
MAAEQTSTFIRELRKAVLLHDPAELTDGQLLGCLLERRDEAAFAALVKRHGPMVWGVCRRLLGHHDAEDAFQATFLVLVRKASSIVPREMLPNWLYGVAHNAALHARRTVARRNARERQVSEMPEPGAVREDLWQDLRFLLDQELSRLPDRYRVLIVLCDLEGKTRKEAARQMGCPEGTVAGRLARARALLAKRLARHGPLLPAGGLAALFARNVATAGAPAAVISSTIQAANLLLVKKAITAAAVSAKVAAITEAVLHAMLLSKLKGISLVLLLLASVGVGLGSLAVRMQAAPNGTIVVAQATPDVGAAPTSPAKQPDEKKPASDQELLQGTWVAVAAESNGRARPDTVQQGFRLRIEGNRFTMGQELALHFPHGTFTLDPTRQPKAIDLTQTYGLPQEKPVRVPGIYELDGTALRICLSYSGGKRPTDFTTAPGSDREMFVFKRPGAAKPQKEYFATRKGNTVTLHPETATFRLTDAMVNWFTSFKNNLHLSRAELTKVENGTGNWDTEYGLVCNAALPFARCCAHVGDEGWGKDAVSYGDLQVRVYVLDQPLDRVQRQIEERAAAKVKETTKQAAKMSKDDDASWKQRKFSYERWYRDYGATAYVDFRARPFDGHTVVFAFMYTNFTNQETKIQTLLQSFTWGARDMEKLQGVWLEISDEVDGKASDTARKGIRLTIQGNRFQWSVDGSSRHQPYGTFALDASKQPKVIDFAQSQGLRQEKPNLIPGIYEFDGATLKICKAVAVVGGKRPTDFTTRPGSGKELLIFRRPPPGSRQGAQEDSIQQDLQRLQGWWVAGTLEENGVAIPLVKPAPGGARYRMIVLTFKDKSFRLQDGDKAWQGNFSIDSQAKPKAMDLSWKRFGGANILPEQTLIARAIYDLKGKTLKVRHALRTTSSQQTGKIISVWEEARPKDFGPGRGWETIVYHRIPDMPKKTDSTAVLLEALEEKDHPFIDAAPVRAAAIDLLGERKAREAIPKLIELLTDGAGLRGSDNWVGGHAANALSAITGRPFSINQKEWQRWWRTQGHK